MSWPAWTRNNNMKTQVLIVAAGPVGLTLALDLGRRGVRCILVETERGTAIPAENGSAATPAPRSCTGPTRGCSTPTRSSGGRPASAMSGLRVTRLWAAAVGENCAAGDLREQLSRCRGARQTGGRRRWPAGNRSAHRLDRRGITGRPADHRVGGRGPDNDRIRPAARGRDPRLRAAAGISLM